MPAQFATLTWGLTLPWGGTPSPVCGTDQMRTVNATVTHARVALAHTSAAAGKTLRVTLQAARAGVLAIAGRASAPAVTLHGPHGTPQHRGSATWRASRRRARVRRRPQHLRAPRRAARRALEHHTAHRPDRAHRLRCRARARQRARDAHPLRPTHPAALHGHAGARPAARVLRTGRGCRARRSAPRRARTARSRSHRHPPHRPFAPSA